MPQTKDEDYWFKTLTITKQKVGQLPSCLQKWNEKNYEIKEKEAHRKNSTSLFCKLSLK